MGFYKGLNRKRFVTFTVVSQLIDMKQIDFGYFGGFGMTIYRACFQQFIKIRYSLEVSEAELSKLKDKTEQIFIFLVEQGIQNGQNVRSILETPDSMGGTCLQFASTCSQNITTFLLDRDIEVNISWIYG